MSYLALSRKYRPQNFDEVVYQEFVVSTLKNAIELGKVSHAYLFTGPRGVGKTSLARIFSKALNCKSPAGVNPCNVCENCIEITNGMSSDVVEIDGASNRGIDEIRQLRESVKFVPLKSKYKLYIIDEIHMLTDPAFNALLKTLEEPPSHVIFLMATTDAHKIPATILSRCQKFDFKKIPYDFMLSYLENILQKEGISYEKDALNLIIRNSEGCMRDALSIMDQTIAFTDNNINLKDTSFLLGMSDDVLINNLFREIIFERMDKLPEMIEEIDAKSINFQFVLKKFIESTRTLLFAANTGNFPDETTAYEKSFFTELLAHVSEQKLFAIFQIFTNTFTEIRNFSFGRYIFEFGIYKAVKIADILNISDFENKKIPNAEYVKSPKTNVHKISEPIATFNKNEFWGSFLEYIGKTKPGLSANLAHSYIVSLENSKLTVGFAEEKRFHYEICVKRENYLFLEEAIKKFNTEVSDFEIVIEQGSKKKALIQHVKEAETFYERQVRNEAMGNEVVNTILREFDGKIDKLTIFNKKINYKEV